MGRPHGTPLADRRTVRPQRTRRTGAKGLFERPSAREEPASAGGEISRLAMVSTGTRVSQVLARIARTNAAATPAKSNQTAHVHPWKEPAGPPKERLSFRFEKPTKCPPARANPSLRALRRGANDVAVFPPQRTRKGRDGPLLFERHGRCMASPAPLKSPREGSQDTPAKWPRPDPSAMPGRTAGARPSPNRDRSESRFADMPLAPRPSRAVEHLRIIRAPRTRKSRRVAQASARPRGVIFLRSIPPHIPAAQARLHR